MFLGPVSIHILYTYIYTFPPPTIFWRHVDMLSVWLCSSIHLSICLSSCLSICLYACLPAWPSEVKWLFCSLTWGTCNACISGLTDRDHTSVFCLSIHLPACSYQFDCPSVCWWTEAGDRHVSCTDPIPSEHFTVPCPLAHCSF